MKRLGNIMKKLFLILFALLCPALKAEPTIEDWPLQKVANPETGTLNLDVLRLFWEDYCAQTTKDELTALLTPFKDLNSQYFTDERKHRVEKAFAEIFWKGECVHPDREYAKAIYKDTAHTYGIASYNNFLKNEYRSYPGHPHQWAEKEIIFPSQSDTFYFIMASYIDNLTVDQLDLQLNLQSGFFFYQADETPPLLAEKQIVLEAFKQRGNGGAYIAIKLRSGLLSSATPYYHSFRWLYLTHRAIQNPYSGQMLAYWLREEEFLDEIIKEYSSLEPDGSSSSEPDGFLKISNMILTDLINQGNLEVLPFAFCLLAKHPSPNDSSKATMLNLARKLQENGNDAAIEMIKPDGFMTFILKFFETLSLVSEDKLHEINEAPFPTVEVNINACMAKVAPNYKWREFGVDRM